ncbi:MAG: hypothetical protein ACJAY7_000857 [Pseudohongiellaceae bacterium]|jgi:hypothetical protein
MIEAPLQQGVLAIQVIETSELAINCGCIEAAIAVTCQ